MAVTSVKPWGGPTLESIIAVDGTSFWYLELSPETTNGAELQRDLKRVKECPLEELPLFMNTIFEPIVLERLK